MISDKDLQSIQEARTLVNEAYEAQQHLSQFSQEQVDAIVDKMAYAAQSQSEGLAKLAVEETGYGNIPDKTIKNRFAAENIYRYIRPVKTVGVIKEDRQNGIVEIATPAGVVCAVIPSTNPTSTAIYKILICIKARNCIVLSPHPAAAHCIEETTRVMKEAAHEAGLPHGCISCMRIPTIEGTTELMKHKYTSLILATGGMGLVKAAYSSGKPAFGVGPGNVPAYVDRSADVQKAIQDILAGKCFDYGTLCSSEQAIVADRPVAQEVFEKLKRSGAYILSSEEVEKLNRIVMIQNRSLNTAIVGKSAKRIAEMAGISVPADTRALVGKIEGVGRDYPLSIEKLSPILAFYVVDGWKKGCERCNEILRFGGTGHTLAVHADDPNVVHQFALHKLAFRIVVNTPASHGSIGYTTNLVPSLTLGCGTWGGNITTDNISALNLINIKRLAYETRPIHPSGAGVSTRSLISQHEVVPGAVISSTINIPNREVIREIVEEFLRKKTSDSTSAPLPPSPVKMSCGTSSSPPKPVAFVCEDDVRRAIDRNEKIAVNAKTIITPAARDLGEERQVFSWV
ncbi:MAG: acetaldehyde dehydrogenase (acetylating) [Acidobacteria bacterium]|nr:acetaldehyde dehydrogenase (acetylating) [Acidobacteriota bacterium]